MARGAVVDLQSVTKKKVAHSRNWALLDSNGETQTLDADKYAIMHRVRIHARDLRILDPLLSYPSTILGRDQAIVLNLEHFKAIITAEEVLLRNPSDEHVIPIMEELCRRLPKGSATQRTDLLGDGQEQLNESHDVDAGDEDESPFEFRALEVALEAICTFLDARTTELEIDAYPALDELTSKCHTRKAMDLPRGLQSQLCRNWLSTTFFLKDISDQRMRDHLYLILPLKLASLPLIGSCCWERMTAGPKRWRNLPWRATNSFRR